MKKVRNHLHWWIALLLIQFVMMFCFSTALAELVQNITENGMYISTDTGEMIYPVSKNWYQIDEIQPSIYRVIVWIEGEGERCSLYNTQTGLSTGFIYWQAYGADVSNGPILVLDQTGFYYINVYWEPIMSQRYFDAQPFSCGLAWAEQEDGQVGFINSSGEYIIRGDSRLLYNEIFAEKLCVVYDNELDKYGYIDTEGKICIPIKYEYASSFEGELAYVKYQGTVQYINTCGEVVKSCSPIGDE